jgi:predicted TIM-barrel fold metal-dependent hydrolase
MTPRTLNTKPVNDANRLGLDYRIEAGQLPYAAPIFDVHTHIRDIEAARLYFEVADLFGVDKVWSMTNLENIDAIRDAYGDQIAFIAVPNYDKRDEPNTFTSDWLRRIEQFADKGVKICKFWAAPRGRDFHPEALRLDSPIRREAMKIAHDAGMMFMVHVADPDTWFSTKYADAATYGTKASQYEPLEALLDEYRDTPWLAAHMGGHPEELDHLKQLLDDHPNLHLDTSATKWMVRELSKQPDALRAFCVRNEGRVLFGTDIVANAESMHFDLFASRFWALRTMFETTYAGPSPIVDPDLSMVDPSLAAESTATLRGAGLAEKNLDVLYRDAARGLMPGAA